MVGDSGSGDTRIGAPQVEEAGRHVGFVAERLLCTGCASCDAACPEDAIVMGYSSRSGVFEPHIDEQRCTYCGVCVAACPGYRLDMGEWPPQGQADHSHPLIGDYQGIWRVHTSDEQLRATAASGGAVTEIVRQLFRSGRIDAAVTARMKPESPLQAEAVFVESEQALLETPKSKYCPHPHNSSLKILLREQSSYQRVAFVGLPSQVHGLRNLQKLYPQLRERVPYVLSLFTAHVPSKEASEFLLWRHGLKEEQVANIDYRGDGVPGRLRIHCHDGREVFIPHQHWSYWGHAFSHFFYPPREWLYFDKLSRWADWSVGDNWQCHDSDAKGASTVVCRSREAEQLLDEMRSNGSLIAEEMSAEELVHDQDLNNKLNIGIRLKVWRWLGGSIPDYRPALPVQGGNTLRTLRFALYVRLCMLRPPFWILSPFIRTDYLVRKKLLRQLRTGWIRLRRTGRSVLRALRILPKLKQDVATGPVILMIGGYGWKDIGDESMPHADLIKLKECLPANSRTVMASVDPEETALRYGEQTVADLQELTRVGVRPMQVLRWSALALLFLLGVIAQKVGWRLAMWPQARAFLDQLASSNLVFNVGGGNLNSLTRGELYKKSVTYLAAALLRVPVVVSGQTIGPFSRLSDRLLARVALDRVRMITFRDEAESRQTTCQLGVKRPTLVDAADDAITLPAVDDMLARRLLAEETGVDLDRERPELLVMLNCKASLSLFKKAGQTHDLAVESRMLQQLAERLLQLEGVRLIFMATDFTDGVDDRVVHREVRRRLSDPDRAHVLEREYTDRELKGMIAQADLALGMRYHFHVFAASEGIPFLGFASGEYQMRKLRGLANLLSEPGCYFGEDIEQADFEALWQAAAGVIDDRESLAHRLQAKVPALKEASQQSINLACSLLSGSGEHL